MKKIFIVLFALSINVFAQNVHYPESGYYIGDTQINPQTIPDIVDENRNYISYNSDSNNNATALTIGNRMTNSSIGKSSVAIGTNIVANEDYSYSSGYNAKSTNKYAYVYNGDISNTNYSSHGTGSFNINPSNGLQGFYIGETNLYTYIQNSRPQGYATEEWVNDQGFLTDQSLDGYATEEWVNNQEFLKQQNLNGYATEEWVGNFIVTNRSDSSIEKEIVIFTQEDSLLIDLNNSNIQCFVRANNASGKYNILLPELAKYKIGQLTLYLQEFPLYYNFQYDISEENIRNGFDDKPWLDKNNDNSLWKLYFESDIEGKWQFKYAELVLNYEHEFTEIIKHSDNTSYYTNVTGTLTYTAVQYYPKAVNVGTNVEIIGSYSLGWNTLQSVKIPDSVKLIEANAFRECKSLKEIIIPNSVTSIQNNAFYYCTNLTNIVLSKNLNSISSYQFQYCFKLKTIDIPDSVTNISDYAFYSCTGLTNMLLTTNILSVGSYAFYGCTNLQTIYAPYEWENTDMLQNAGIPQNCNIIYGIQLSKTNEIFDTAYPITNQEFSICSATNWTVTTTDSWINVKTSYGDNCATINYDIDVNYVASPRYGSIIVDDGNNHIRKLNITQTGDDIWQYTINNDLAHITGCAYKQGDMIIPSMLGGVPVNSIDGFGWSQDIISVVIPSTVEYISDTAFYECNNLLTVTLTNGLKNIGANAFKNCYRLGIPVFPSTLTNISDKAFWNCQRYAPTPTIIPGSVKSIGAHAFYVEARGSPGRGFITDLVLENGVERVGYAAFCMNERLMSVKIPPSLTTIGVGAFVPMRTSARITVYCIKVDGETDEDAINRVSTLLTNSQAFDSEILTYVISQ